MAGQVKELERFMRTTKELRGLVGELVGERLKTGKSSPGLKEAAKMCVVKMAEVRKANRDAHEAADSMLCAAEAERNKTDQVSQQVRSCCMSGRVCSSSAPFPCLPCFVHGACVDSREGSRIPVGKGGGQTCV